MATWVNKPQHRGASQQPRVKIFLNFLIKIQRHGMSSICLKYSSLTLFLCASANWHFSSSSFIVVGVATHHTTYNNTAHVWRALTTLTRLLVHFCWWGGMAGWVRVGLIWLENLNWHFSRIWVTCWSWLCFFPLYFHLSLSFLIATRRSLH